jgi:FAD/FMN-containing dehydrogenase
LLRPGDPSFDTLRRVHSFNPETDKQPAGIVRCASTADVARSVAFAREAELEIAVRSGGCDLLGASDCQGGLLIDLRAMDKVVIDRDRRIARVRPGVSSGALVHAAAGTALAPVLGCHPGVGVGGLVLGGGIGWLAGAHGAACDHLLAAEVVTADGRVLTATAQDHPELFWAIRGGGGNFGVVTSLDLDLVAVDQVLAGTVAFSIDAEASLPAFLRFYRDFMLAAPDALAVELNLGMMGDKRILLATACWSGDAPAGQLVLAPLRAYARPLFDSIGAAHYARLAEGAPPLPPNLLWRGASVDGLSNAAIDQLAASIAEAPPGWSVGMGHFIHGQIARDDPAATALPRRTGQMTYFVGAGWGDGQSGDAGMTWVRATMAAMKPWSSERTYINYLSDDSEAAVRAAYGPRYARLLAAKRTYDPDNLFHLNRNIRP